MKNKNSIELKTDKSLRSSLRGDSTNTLKTVSNFLIKKTMKHSILSLTAALLTAGLFSSAAQAATVTIDSLIYQNRHLHRRQGFPVLRLADGDYHPRFDHLHRRLCFFWLQIAEEDYHPRFSHLHWRERFRRLHLADSCHSWQWGHLHRRGCFL